MYSTFDFELYRDYTFDFGLTGIILYHVFWVSMDHTLGFGLAWLNWVSMDHTLGFG